VKSARERKRSQICGNRGDRGAFIYLCSRLLCVTCANRRKKRNKARTSVESAFHRTQAVANSTRVLLEEIIDIVDFMIAFYDQVSFSSLLLFLQFPVFPISTAQNDLVPALIYVVIMMIECRECRR